MTGPSWRMAGASSRSRPNCKAAAEEARVAVVEAAAEGDDALLEKYLDGQELTGEEIDAEREQAMRSGRLVPVCVTAATAGVGTAPLLEVHRRAAAVAGRGARRRGAGQGGRGIAHGLRHGPAGGLRLEDNGRPLCRQADLSAGVLRASSTPIPAIWNQAKGTEERLGTLHVMRGKEQIRSRCFTRAISAQWPSWRRRAPGTPCVTRVIRLPCPCPSIPTPSTRSPSSPRPRLTRPRWAPPSTRLCEEDPTLSWRQEQSTNQTILQGMGDQHIDVAIRKAEAKFQVGLTTETPRVPYRETITRNGKSPVSPQEADRRRRAVRRGPHGDRAPGRKGSSSS